MGRRMYGEHRLRCLQRAMRLALVGTTLIVLGIATWRVVEEPVVQVVREARARDGLERVEQWREALLEASEASTASQHQ